MQDSRMMLACWAGLLLLVSFASSASSTRLVPFEDSDLAVLPERLRDLVLLRRLMYGPEKRGPEPVENSAPVVRKRTCYINGGLSHGCDYMDLVGAMAEKSYWDSLRSPGRRKRQAALQKLFPRSTSAFSLPRSSSSTTSSLPPFNSPNISSSSTSSSSMHSPQSMAPFKHMTLSSMPSSSGFQNPSPPPSPDLSSSDLQ